MILRSFLDVRPKSSAGAEHNILCSARRQGLYLVYSLDFAVKPPGRGLKLGTVRDNASSKTSTPCWEVVQRKNACALSQKVVQCEPVWDPSRPETFS